MSRNIFILLSGGPGVFDPEEEEPHDESWDNFVTPPLLRVQKSLHLEDAQTEELHWLVYEPAYTQRWAADISNKTKAPVQYGHATKIKDQGFSNYLDKLKARAQKWGWKYKGINSASEFWNYIKNLKQKVSRAWYYGHGRNDLWLTVAHDSDHDACAPSAEAIITVSGISKLSSSSFAPRSRITPHKFYGCNTRDFAEKWASHLEVFAEGAKGTVLFRNLHTTGGKIELTSGAVWYQFRTPVETLFSNAGDSVE